MNDNVYSYNECLAILHLCSGLENQLIFEPEAYHIRTLGINQVQKILSMRHNERIELIKDAVRYL